jgi:hypothetical protein
MSAGVDMEGGADCGIVAIEGDSWPVANGAAARIMDRMADRHRNPGITPVSFAHPALFSQTGLARSRITDCNNELSMAFEPERMRSPERAGGCCRSGESVQAFFAKTDTAAYIQEIARVERTGRDAHRI